METCTNNVMCKDTSNGENSHGFKMWYCCYV